MNKKLKKRTKKFKKVKVSKKNQNLKTKPIKNTLAYFECMSACCLKKQKISRTAHECKTNALAINKKISVEKLKAVKELGTSFNKFKSNLERFVQKTIK